LVKILKKFLPKNLGKMFRDKNLLFAGLLSKILSKQNLGKNLGKRQRANFWDFQYLILGGREHVNI